MIAPSERELHPFRSGFDYEPGRNLRGVYPGVGQQAVHRFIIVLRLVVKKHQPGAATFRG
jgi:hypothetical protein